MTLDVRMRGMARSAYRRIRKWWYRWWYSPVEKWCYRRGLRSSDDLCLPDFLGIGAQKAGTTWLAWNLRRHPDIFMPKIKELHYFDHDFHKTLRHYATNFEPGRGKAKGEVTPAYSFLPKGRIRFIRTIMPAVRLILIMRNPIDRAWSHAIFELVTRQRRRFEEVTDSEFKTFFMSEPCVMRTDYPTILENWLSVFPREQLYLGFYEEIVSHPRKLLGNIFSHLGVSDEVDWGSFPHEQVILPHFGPVRDHRGSHTYMPPEIRRFLEQMYARDIERLYERFGESVAGWRTA